MAKTSGFWLARAVECGCIERPRLSGHRELSAYRALTMLMSAWSVLETACVRNGTGRRRSVSRRLPRAARLGDGHQPAVSFIRP